jgi:anti-anti-sigma factor
MVSNADRIPPPVLGVDVTYPGELIVEVAVTGEIDMATAAQLRAMLLATIDAQSPRHLTIDIAGVGLVDAAGMTTLVQIFQHARRQHIKIRLVNARPLVARMIEVGGLTRFLGLTTGSVR